MRKLGMLLAVSNAVLFAMPYAYAADVVEYHALMTPSREVEIVDTVPQPLPSGYTVINEGAVVTPGETITIPNSGSVVLPQTLRSHMKVKIKSY